MRVDKQEWIAGGIFVYGDKMRFRRAYIILDILAAACFAGAHYLKEFARTRLGFVRWLNFNGNKLTENYPVGRIKFIMLAVILLLVVAAVFLTSVRKIRFAGINGIVMCAVTVAAAVYYVYASVAFDYSYSQAYFLIIPVIALGTLLLALRTMIPPLKTGSPVPQQQADKTEAVKGSIGE